MLTWTYIIYLDIQEIDTLFDCLLYMYKQNRNTCPQGSKLLHNQGNKIADYKYIYNVWQITYLGQF